jgi:hypothetical protein
MVSASASCQETVPRASIRPAGFETARLELWAQALSGINQRQTLIVIRKSTLEHYDFIEKIAFVCKASLKSLRQRSNDRPKIVVTVTVG